MSNSKAFRSLPTQFLQQQNNSVTRYLTKKVNILNIDIDNLLKTEVLEKLQSGVVFTPNVDHLMKLQNDPEFLQAYTSADYKLCDSQILIYASKFLGNPIKEKISGSDFFPAFYNFHKKNKNIKIFLLGAAKGVAAKAQQRINSQVGRNVIVGSYSPSFGFEKNEQECRDIVDLINKSGATVLAVGLGAPKQEKWIYKYKNELPNIKIFLAIGATLDFEAGNISRAPKLMSEMGLEWLYRMTTEPKRLWKRYLIEDLPFFWLILRQKLNLYSMRTSENQSGE
ncbi:MAG: WecB/TagA/CpsF family glycosyltransferase [Mojavia pulchra JT2-VF2]|jgi:exopolysaccharide biosynthesis WecB/TagA/CpsF family protein|uniref:WecB/TagA/CpsF family glycosyltransferase n=1 Tax=Mojavia pulchra JT2-VF2 TaxID=287848 RepID=A0A951PXW9_9NOST|nr:WecB/TagA/CpsF family glycosyltransferase [Mojavia pulchra JT2-VF2]